MDRARLLPTIALTVALVWGAVACSDGAADRSPSAGGTLSDAVKTREVRGGGVAFEVPIGFTSFDPEKVMSAGEDSAQFQEVVDQLGVSKEQFRQLYSKMALMVLSPVSAASGFANNINVTALDGVMPSEDQLRDQLETIGLTVDDVDTTDTDTGDALVSRYHGDIGAADVKGANVLVALAGKVVTITVSTSDAGSRIG